MNDYINTPKGDTIGSAYLKEFGFRIKKCAEHIQCLNIKKYMRYLRLEIRKKGSCLTNNGVERLLKMKCKEL